MLVQTETAVFPINEIVKKFFLVSQDIDFKLETENMGGHFWGGFSA